MHGYHGRILNVNLSSGQVAIETFDETFARQYLGDCCTSVWPRASIPWRLKT